MTFTNDIYEMEPLQDGIRPAVRKEVLELLTLMLAPMTPHIAEEMWGLLGHSNGLWSVGWPSVNSELTKEDEVEVPVQVNGKLRGKLKVPVGISQPEIVKLATVEPAIAVHLDSKRIVKVIYVPDKLLNLVIG